MLAACQMLVPSRHDRRAASSTEFMAGKEGDQTPRALRKELGYDRGKLERSIVLDAREMLPYFGVKLCVLWSLFLSRCLHLM